MANAIRTTRTYATPANAQQALRTAAGRMGVELEDVRWIVAVVEHEGRLRYAPAVLGADHLAVFWASEGVTVLG